MLKFIIGNIGCLLGSALTVLLFRPLPIWLSVIIFLVPVTVTNGFLLRSKSSAGRTPHKSGPVVSGVAIAITLWFALNHYYQNKWVSAFADGRLAFENGDYLVAQKQLEIAARLAQQSGKTAGVCKIQNYLSTAYIDQGVYNKAQQASLAAISACTTSGEIHEIVAAQANLGAAYESGGQPEKASAALDEALALARKNPKPDELQLATIFNDYAVLRQSEGRSNDAESYLRQAIAIVERYPSVKNPDIATCYNNLGRVLFAQGKLDEAEGLYKKSIQTAQQKYSPNSPELSPVLNNLALLYERKSKFNDAKALLETAISNMEKSPAPDTVQLESIKKNYQRISQEATRE